MNQTTIDPGLLAYLARQQNIACRLAALLEGVAVLRNENAAEEAQDAIIEIAAQLANDLNINLDSVNLKKVDAA